MSFRTNVRNLNKPVSLRFLVANAPRNDKKRNYDTVSKSGMTKRDVLWNLRKRMFWMNEVAKIGIMDDSVCTFCRQHRRKAY